jgi:glucokinase
MSAEPFTVGVDVGGTNIRAAKVSRSGAILKKTSVAGSRIPADALRTIKSLAVEMDIGQAGAVGIGIPGRVDGRTGEVISGGYLNLAGIDLRMELNQEFGLPVTVANDCTMALIAEARIGAAQGLWNAAMISIGTGIGGALMESGRIVTGRRCAGQFGHLIVREGGQPCACGQRGCVETESSGTALRRHLDEAGYGPATRFENLLSIAQGGDEKALRVLQSWAAPLRAAIRTLSAAVDPEVVILGGGMGEAALQALAFLPEVKCWYEIEVRRAKLGDDAGVIGAGISAFDLLKPSTGKNLVMVNGVPASGKSTVAKALATQTGWPILSIDTLKDPHLELIENVDRDFNRVLGQASYKAIFAVIRDAAPGTTFIVDAWFGFQPLDKLKELTAMAGITRIAELWCHAPPQTVGERYRRRASSRLPGHPGPDYVPELVTLAGKAQPSRLGPMLEIDTTQPCDLDQVREFVAREFGRHREQQ